MKRSINAKREVINFGIVSVTVPVLIVIPHFTHSPTHIQTTVKTSHMAA